MLVPPPQLLELYRDAHPGVSDVCSRALTSSAFGLASSAVALTSSDFASFIIIRRDFKICPAVAYVFAICPSKHDFCDFLLEHIEYQCLQNCPEIDVGRPNSDTVRGVPYCALNK